VAIILGTRNGRLDRSDAYVLLAGYPVFVIVALA
jgi:hypothetical protein